MIEFRANSEPPELDELCKIVPLILGLGQALAVLTLRPYFTSDKVDEMQGLASTSLIRLRTEGKGCLANVMLRENLGNPLAASRK